jgi:hypothetical protein
MKFHMVLHYAQSNSTLLLSLDITPSVNKMLNSHSNGMYHLVCAQLIVSILSDVSYPR